MKQCNQIVIVDTSGNRGIMKAGVGVDEVRSVSQFANKEKRVAGGSIVNCSCKHFAVVETVR